jgi:hypothetical protein
MDFENDRENQNRNTASMPARILLKTGHRIPPNPGVFSFLQTTLRGFGGDLAAQ